MRSKKILLPSVAALLLFCGGCETPEEQRTGRILPLRIATGDSGDGLKPYQALVASFTAANPIFSVTVDTVAGDDYYAALQRQALDPQAAPHALLVGEDAVGRMVKAGALLDLTPFLAQDEPLGLDPSIYLPGLARPGQWQDKTYLLPKDYSTVAVYYNRQLFDAAGVPHPREGWTWSEFQQAAAKLTDQPSGIYGVQLPAAWPRGFEAFVQAAGGQLISEDGTRIQGFMDSDAVAGALRFYADLYKAGVAAPATDLSAFGGGEDFFAKGKAAMRVFGHWPQAGYRSDPSLKDALAVVSLPVGKQRATVIAWAGFGVAAATPYKHEGFHLVRHLTNTTGASEWANWGLPAVTAVAERRGLSQDPLDSAWLATLADLRPIAAYASPYWGEVGEPELARVLSAVVRDPSADVKALLSAAAQAAQTALDSKNK